MRHSPQNSFRNLVLLNERTSTVLGSEKFRYGFNNMEADDEQKGSGNSYDFGARMLDTRLGSFLSLDAFASKFAYQSPYSFAANSPIWAKDSNGDSVLFYSKAGNYLGYSYDNLRYKGKNLLVIIDDKNVQTFNKEYQRKRNLPDNKIPKGTTPAIYKESIVAGLEAMGTTYDVTEISGFLRKYENLIKDKEGNTITSKIEGVGSNGEVYREQQEWGTWMVSKENPYVDGLNNWQTLGEVVNDRNTYVGIPPTPEGGGTWLHSHTATSKTGSFSGNDMQTMRGRAQKGGYLVGQVQNVRNGKKTPGGISISYHNSDQPSGSSGGWIGITEKSFKEEPKKNK